MKFKLDENFGTRTQRIFRAAGHDVQTVRDEGLQGSSDQHLYDVCCFEQRCLVTLDLDFADTIRFQPVQGSFIFNQGCPKFGTPVHEKNQIIDVLCIPLENIKSCP